METKVRDLTVYYEEVGEGRPLLMLHGWPTDHRHIFADMEPLFADRTGWRRIYPDMPGMGKTPSASWITQQDHMLEVILEFLDAVAPGERFCVAGTSYGGYMARGVLYRRLAQVDGLFITVPVVEGDSEKWILPSKQVLVEDPAFLAALHPGEEVSLDIAVVQSLDLLEHSRAVITPAIAAADNEFLDRLSENYAFTFEVDALPAPFLAPALILAGRQDHWCGYQGAWQLLENYPRGTYAVLDRSGHALGTEQLSLFRALASEWLDRVEEYTLVKSLP